MVTVTLFKLDGNENIIYTMSLRNFKTFNPVLSFPVVPTPLPQEDASKNILLKLEGNSTTVKFSWTMKDEVTSIITEVAGITTISKQFNFWREFMRPVDIEDRYKLVVNFTDVSGGIEFNGTLTNMQFDMNDGSPVTFNASFDFIEGEINGGIYELDTPSPPIDLVASSPSSGQLKLDWSPSTDAGSSAVNLWKFQYKLSGNTWQTVDVASIDNTHTEPGLTAGTYSVRVVGANIYGLGTPSVIKTQVVA